MAAAASEAAGTARAVFVQDFLLNWKGRVSPALPSFLATVSGPAQRTQGPVISDLSLDRILTICRGEVYRASSQAGPGNDINAGSAGSQKAPT
jgi:hypothetical protein